MRMDPFSCTSLSQTPWLLSYFVECLFFVFSSAAAVRASPFETLTKLDSICMCLQVWCTWCWSPTLRVRCLTSRWFPSASATTECSRNRCLRMSYWVSPNPKKAPQYVLVTFLNTNMLCVKDVKIQGEKCILSIWKQYILVFHLINPSVQVLRVLAWIKRIISGFTPSFVCFFSLQGLLKASKVLREAYGSMHVTFGRPLSVRQLCQGKINRCQYNLIPR